MNQQPDKFFRDKLQHFEKAAPATAWDKIAAAQTKKKDKGLWLKIAASLLLLAIAGYLLWQKSIHIDPQENILSERHTSESPADSTKQESTEKTLTKPEVNVESKNNLQANADTKSEKTFSKRNTAVTKNNGEETKAVLTIADQKQDEPAINEIDIVNETSVVDSTKTVIAEVQSNNEKEIQNITLIYSAKEVDEYLDKNALAEATSGDKKPSTLKKLLQKANELKNNQDPFGELRQKKNEILALNFKNEKRGQNK